MVQGDQTRDLSGFDMFYLHNYSHGFSNFNDIVIQFFQKNVGHDCGNTSAASLGKHLSVVEP